jgi:hypothetical protein
MNSDHPAYETLAELAEGLLEDDQAASVKAHLDSCADCQGRSADLADVSRLLAEASVPSMPAELASRIDSAIAAESLNNATVVSLEQRRGRRHWRILSAAAATVVVLGGGALVSKMALDASDGDHQGAIQPRQPVISDNQKTGDARRPSLRSAPEGAGRFGVVRSGTEYRSATLGRQVGQVVAGRGGGMASVQSPTTPDQRLAGCVGRVAQGRPPVLVDQANYEGSPAIVIAVTGGQATNVTVVRPDCSAGAATVLGRGTVPR